MLSNFKFDSLKEFQKMFSTELRCIKYLIQLRWNGVLTCPRCNKSDMAYKYKIAGKFGCGHCRREFSIRIGTIFEDSHKPLTDWFLAFYLEVNTTKGISSCQLAEHLDTRQQTAWFMLQRIRWALQHGTIEKFTGDVEVDETYVGGKEGNKHKDKKTPRGALRGSNDSKMAIVGVLQRGGALAMQKIRKANIECIKPVLHRYIDFTRTTLNTDESTLYKGYARQTVCHSKGEYVRDNVSTNGIEGAFGHFKRMVLGVFMQISSKHVDKYINGFTFRYNNRGLDGFERFNEAMGMAFGKRLMYKELVR